MDERWTVRTEELPRIARALSDDPGLRVVSHPSPCDVVLRRAGDARIVLVESGRAAASGANGMVTFDTGADELRLAVRAVACGARYVASELVEKPAARLAPREIETLSLLARGLTHRQIANHMRITETTVDTYVKRLRGKLKAGNKAQLTRTAIELGYLLTPRPVGTLLTG